MSTSSGNDPRQQLLTNLNDAIKAALAYRDALVVKQSGIDKDVNSLYHIIECMSLNAAQQSKVMKKLKTTLQARRECKEEINFWNLILNKNGFENAKIDTSVAIADHDKDAAKRDVKYTRESVASYEKLFGEPFKKVKKDDQ